MWTWQQWLMFIGTLTAGVSIIPLMVWGGSGSWRRALQALREYLAIMGTLVAMVSLLALALLLVEVTGR
jgi:hypothetical protein